MIGFNISIYVYSSLEDSRSHVRDRGKKGFEFKERSKLAGCIR